MCEDGWGQGKERVSLDQWGNNSGNYHNNLSQTPIPRLFSDTPCLQCFAIDIPNVHFHLEFSFDIANNFLALSPHRDSHIRFPLKNK